MAYKNIAQAIVYDVLSRAISKKNPARILDLTIKNKTQIINDLNDFLSERLKNYKQYSADSLWDCGWWNCCWIPNTVTVKLIDNIANGLYEKSLSLQTALTSDPNPPQRSGIQFSDNTIISPNDLFSQFNVLEVLDKLLVANPETKPLLPPIQMTPLRN